jgi:curli production assembly/transport component CsgF
MRLDRIGRSPWFARVALSAMPLGMAVLVWGAAGAGAGELVYSPINPAFGGSPANKDFLLGTAEAQNRPRRKDQKRSELSSQDRLASFTQTLQQRLLSGLADKIVETIYGTNPQNSGTFSVDGTTVYFVKEGGNVRLTVSDGLRSTTISLPSP